MRNIMDTSHLSTETTRRSCWGFCPSNYERNGCCPWRISCLETLIHAIPGIGIITAGLSWLATTKKVEQLLREARMPIHPEECLDSKLVKLSDCLEKGCSKPAVLQYELIESNEAPFTWDEYHLLSAKRINRCLMAALNCIGLGIAFVSMLGRVSSRT